MINNNFHYQIEEDTLQLPTLIDNLSKEFDDSDQILKTCPFVGIQGYNNNKSLIPFEKNNYMNSVEDHIFKNLGIRRNPIKSEGEDIWSPPTQSMNISKFSSIQKPLTLPQEGIEIDKKVSLPHMMLACGEALHQGQNGLLEVILRCLKKIVPSPIGDTLERLAFYFSQAMTKNYYLTQEASKNFEQVFRAFYQGVPHGKVAHFAANSSIFEAIPHDCEVIHIVDFDMGEGVQWPPMIEAIAKLNKALNLTSIKWGEENFDYVSATWKFEETRKKLYECARSCGLKLKLEEKGIEELVFEIKKMNKRSGKREFLAFNCMVGLPHMGREKNERYVVNFLNLINSVENRGIVTFGDGRGCKKLKNCLEFRSFFEGHFGHYKALLESIESHFPTPFLEARISMECLFIAPNISSLAWLQNWEEIKEDFNLKPEIGLESCKLSKEILMEVKEMLSGCDDSYQARIEGKNQSELILEWKGNQLVKFSTWRN